MKRDNLEQFITEHRAEFDTAQPPLHLWAGIERQLERQAPKASAGGGRIVPMLFISRLKFAAGVAALLVVGFIAGLNIARQQQVSSLAEIERVNPDFRDAEKYYTGQIDRKLAQLASYNGNTEAVLQDLAQVDEIMAELKGELASAPAGAEEQIVSDLIRSYRTKVAILEKVLEGIQTKDQYQSKTQHNETGI